MPSLPPRACFAAAAARHTAALSCAAPGDVTFRGVLYAGVAITRVPGEMRNEQGGLMDVSELEITLAKSRLTLAPGVGEVVTIDSQSWIVRKVAGELVWEADWIMTVSK